MTRYYVDQQGNYLGGFDGSTPAGGVEVPSPPNHGWDRWVNGVWVPLTAAQIAAKVAQK